LDSRLTNLISETITVAKSKEVKTRSNLVQSSKEGYGSKSVILPMMMLGQHLATAGYLHSPIRVHGVALNWARGQLYIYLTLWPYSCFIHFNPLQKAHVM
jgi:hypothetical protein